MKSNVIYKIEDGYLIDGVKLYDHITNEIEGCLLNKKLRFNGNFDIFCY
jgi:hypothetical protein